MPGEDAFKFAHALIREVAYAGLPKRLRADLHERLAHWLTSRDSAVDAIIGYHLEQAYRLRIELAPRRRPRASAGGGGGGAAGVGRARARSPAATRSRGAPARARGRALPEDDLERPAMLSALGGALAEAGRLADADRALSAAIAEDGGGAIAARARVEQQFVRLHAGQGTTIEEARAVADAALEELRRARRPSRAVSGPTAAGVGRLDRKPRWSTPTRPGAAPPPTPRRAGEERMLFDILGWRASAAVFGPTPVPAAILHCEQFREQVESSPFAVAVTLHPLGLLHAMTGDFELARRLIRDGNEILRDLGRMESAVSHHESMVEMLAGRPGEAEARLRPGYETLDEWASARCWPPPRRCSRRPCTRRSGSTKLRSCAR